MIFHLKLQRVHQALEIPQLVLSTPVILHQVPMPMDRK